MLSPCGWTESTSSQVSRSGKARAEDMLPARRVCLQGGPLVDAEELDPFLGRRAIRRGVPEEGHEIGDVEVPDPRRAALRPGDDVRRVTAPHGEPERFL